MSYVPLSGEEVKERHRAAMRKWYKKFYWTRRGQGLCSKCGKKADAQSATCTSCKENRRLSVKLKRESKKPCMT